MRRIMVAGIGTDVGKTVVSAILTLLFQGDYWKPIQCGNEANSDTATMKGWLEGSERVIHPPAYSFQAPVSPHAAARLEKMAISTESISLPETTRPLIIEGVGGLLVPYTVDRLTIDLFASWRCSWVVVSKHYLGSINHTLLTIEALKRRRVPLLGLIFNGAPHPDTEEAILQISELPLLGRLFPEQNLNLQTFQRYGEQWQSNFYKHLP